MVSNKEKIIFYVAVVFAILAFLASISGILLPFVLAAILAYLIDPIVDKLESKINRSFLSFSVVSLFIMVVLVVLVLSVPAALKGIQEAGELFTKSDQIVQTKILTIANKVLPIDLNVEDISQLVQTHSQDVLKYLTKAVQTLAVSTMKVFDFFSIFFITPIALFYMLRDWDKITETLETLLPRNEKSYVNEVLRKIDNKMSCFIRGQLLVSLSLGIFYGIGLSVVGLKLGLLIGFLTGLLSFMPYVGITLGAVVSAILALLQFPLTDITPFAMIAGVFALGQLLESLILSPKLVGDALSLHPLWIIFAILAGGELKGFLGILIALPVSAIVSVLLKELIEYYKSTKIYKTKSKKKKAKKTKDVELEIL